VMVKVVASSAVRIGISESLSMVVHSAKKRFETSYMLIINP